MKQNFRAKLILFVSITAVPLLVGARDLLVVEADATKAYYYGVWAKDYEEAGRIWNGDWPGLFHPNFNPDCYGCHQGDSLDGLNGHPGWRGTHPMNPYAPNGGPGGEAVDGEGGRGGD